MSKKIKLQKKQSDCFWYKNLDKFFEIAVYFGFKPYKDLEISKDDLKLTKKIQTRFKTPPEEKNLRYTSALVSTININLNEIKKNPVPHLMVFAEKTKPHQKYKKLFLEVASDISGFAEILIIKTALTILKEVKEYKKTKLFINSIGDDNSINHFTKEFNTHYNKNILRVASTCRNNSKIDPFSILHCSHEQCKIVAEDAPKPFSFLTEQSRKYFKEVLEDLEATNINYKINDKMTLKRPFANQTIFMIKNKEGTIIAEGGRYNKLINKMGYRREFPAVGITLLIPNKQKTKPKNLKTPKIFFIQIGPEAKMKSLNIIDTLRQNKILVMQSLIRNKISVQLGLAEKYKIPYALIIGQQEALENVIILRNLKNREQYIIPIKQLSEKIKKYI